MKQFFVVLLIFCTFPVFAAPKDEAINAELEKLQGTYSCVSLETDEMKGDAERIKRVKLVVTDKKWTVYIDDKVSTLSTFTIDPAKKPKAIDMTGTMGGDKGVKYLAIYELVGDELKLCIGNEKTRPRKFEAKNGTHHQLEHWKRLKE